MDEKNPHLGHRKRLKERFRQEGPDGFNDINALELLLFYAIPRGDTNPIAHRLLEQFHSISAVFDAPLEALMEVEGIGESAAQLLKLVPAMGRRYQEDKVRDVGRLDSSTKIGEYILPKFYGRTDEIVYLICLDNTCKVLSCTLLLEGSVNAVQISVRKIVEYAIRFNTSNVILAHNHPNGLALPSNSDIVTTEKIVKALQLMNITLIDHIIVSKTGDYISFAESGYLHENELRPKK